MGFPVFPLQWTNAEGETSHGYREDGYFPEAFVNLLAMLGWNPGDERELFSLEELVQAFSLDKVQKAGAKFNPDKAKWYNREYLRMKDDAELADLFVPVLREHGVTVTGGPSDPVAADFASHTFSWTYVKDVVTLIKERATFVKDFWTVASYLFVAPSEYVQKDVDKFWKPEISDCVKEAAEYLLTSGVSFEKDAVGPALEEYIRAKEWPMGKVMNALRLSLSGAASGLGIADILSFIGPEEMRRRLQAI
jgi:glutamyl-tRNA synthetase